MTAEALPVSRETALEPNPDDLPRGPKQAYKRALANGFRVRIAHGLGSREIQRSKPLPANEDGTPQLTPTGRPKTRKVKVAVPAVSIGLHLQHNEGQQGQCAWWVEGDSAPVCWAWPSDGSDVRRRILASQLGTLVDLDAMRTQSIVVARAEIDQRLSLEAIRKRALGAGRR